MLRELSAGTASWPLTAPFRIARGVRHSAETVTVEISGHGCMGRGESIPYARYGESVSSVLAQVRLATAAVANGLSRTQLEELLPPGAARNAIDCALWDLEANRSGVPVSAALGHGPLPELDSARTVGIDTPERMAKAAADLAGLALVKVKVDADDPAARIRAVRQAVPDARLIVDPNESWDIELLRALQPMLLDARVDLVEQPLPADADAALEGFRPEVPVCADESCHVAGDLPRLANRYQAVNIKLDKTGGLSGALRLLDAARAAGFRIMVGCMVGTSLGIAPALHVARHAEFVDLDGPLWLRRDRDGGVRMHNGKLLPPHGGFWGGPAATDPGVRAGAHLSGASSPGAGA